MAKKKKDMEQEENRPAEETVDAVQDEQQTEAQEPGTEEGNEWEVKYHEMHDKYVRVYSEFENFRRRTARERLEMEDRAAGSVVKEILPVLDDLIRASAHNQTVEDPAALREGFDLVVDKMTKILASKGVKAMAAKGETFDPEIHEAITKFPAPEPELKGKVIDVIEEGYYINETVLRYAKVVVGE